MKIYNNIIKNNIESSKKQQKSPKKEGCFFEVLKEASKDIKNNNINTNKGIELNNVILHNIEGCNKISQIRRQAVEIGEQVLDLLSDCSVLLSEPNLNHSRLESLGSALEGEVDSIKQIREKLEPNDPLRYEIERIGILGVVESIKIKRGDYS